MKHLIFLILILFSLIAVQGCNLIGDIFQIGLWAGIIVVVLVVLLIVFIISKIKKRF